MINCNENVNEKTDYIVNRPRHRSTQNIQNTACLKTIMFVFNKQYLSNI